MNRAGNTIVLITHDNMIASKTQRVIRIQDGKIIYDGPALGDEIIKMTLEMAAKRGKRYDGTYQAIQNGN